MFERYTEQARRAVFFACFEANRLRADRISTKHLLLGLSWDENSRAVAIGSLKDQIVDLCGLMEIPHRPSTDVPNTKHLNISLDQDAKVALAYAAEEADLDCQFWIDTDHLLRGLLRFPNEASSSLESIPLDLATARAASKHRRIEFPPQRTPLFPKLIWFLWPARMRVRRLMPALVKLALFAVVVLLGILISRWL